MSEESFVQNPEFPQPENQQTAEEQAGDAPTEFTRTAQVQINAEMDAVVNDSAVIVMAVGRDAQIHDSLLSGPTAIGGDATLTDSGGILLNVGGQATVTNSAILILNSRGAATLNDSQVMMTTKQALAFGAAAGVILGLINLLFRRRR